MTENGKTGDARGRGERSLMVKAVAVIGGLALVLVYLAGPVLPGWLVLAIVMFVAGLLIAGWAIARDDEAARREAIGPPRLERYVNGEWTEVELYDEDEYDEDES